MSNAILRVHASLSFAHSKVNITMMGKQFTLSIMFLMLAHFSFAAVHERQQPIRPSHKNVDKDNKPLNNGQKAGTCFPKTPFDSMILCVIPSEMLGSTSFISKR